jgi:hypothetical protein
MIVASVPRPKCWYREERNRGRGQTSDRPGAHKLDHLRDREAVREHDRLGAAVGARGEQFERAAAIRFGAAAARYH